MKEEEIRIGMKVVPHKKSIFCPLEQSNVWMCCRPLGQEYLFVVRVDNERAISRCPYWVLSESENKRQGDYFAAEDFEPYVEPVQKVKKFIIPTCKSCKYFCPEVMDASCDDFICAKLSTTDPQCETGVEAYPICQHDGPAIIYYVKEWFGCIHHCPIIK